VHDASVPTAHCASPAAATALRAAKAHVTSLIALVLGGVSGAHAFPQALLPALVAQIARRWRGV